MVRGSPVFRVLACIRTQFLHFFDLKGQRWKKVGNPCSIGMTLLIRKIQLKNKTSLECTVTELTIINLILELVLIIYYLKTTCFTELEIKAAFRDYIYIAPFHKRIMIWHKILPFFPVTQRFLLISRFSFLGIFLQVSFPIVSAV